MRRIGGIEAGGTKFVCVLADDQNNILDQRIVRTTTPEETLGQCIAFFQGHGGVAALGVASFGPLVLDRASPDYGRVAKTPKPHWSGADIVGTLRRGLDCPIALDTDVNGAGLAEALLGAGRGLDVVAYVTVGTGIGGGLIIQGKPVHGHTHPEMGHVKLRQHPRDEGFNGVCPFHGDCLEGLASGPAVMARLGHPLNEASPDHPIWDMLAYYLGELCAVLTLVASPQTIVLGGGVMSNPALFPKIRAACAISLGGYVQPPSGLDADRAYIVPPALGDRAGAIGALLLVRDAPA